MLKTLHPFLKTIKIQMQFRKKDLKNVKVGHVIIIPEFGI